MLSSLGRGPPSVRPQRRPWLWSLLGAFGAKKMPLLPAVAWPPFFIQPIEPQDRIAGLNSVGVLQSVSGGQAFGAPHLCLGPAAFNCCPMTAGVTIELMNAPSGVQGGQVAPWVIPPPVAWPPTDELSLFVDHVTASRRG
jgi:hypothetical protein